MDNFEAEELIRPRPNIKVVGISSVGIATLELMDREELEGVGYVAISTSQDELKRFDRFGHGARIHLAGELVPDRRGIVPVPTGPMVADSRFEELRRALEGAELVFLLGDLCESRGIGAAPLLGHLAREMGALTIAAVVVPDVDVPSESVRGRIKQGEAATEADRILRELSGAVDTAIVIPDRGVPRLMDLIPGRPDEINPIRALLFATQAVTDTVRVTGEVNVDFSDLKWLLSNRGIASLGTGFGRGENRAVEAAQEAISSLLLDNISIQGAAGVLINISGGVDLAIDEVTTISGIIQDAAGEEAEIIFGAVHETHLIDEIRVTLIVVGPKPRTERGHPPTIAETPAHPAIIIAWDPEHVEPDIYAEVVEILGELTRLEGGAGISRIRSDEVGVPAPSEVGV